MEKRFNEKAKEVEYVFTSKEVDDILDRFQYRLLEAQRAYKAEDSNYCEALVFAYGVAFDIARESFRPQA